MTTQENKTLVTGQVYDVDSLEFAGWTVGDDSGHEGYSYLDYFRDGKYLGADANGIEPLFAE